MSFSGNEPLAGVDEAGRGPVAGPGVAAAVILPPQFSAREALRDSKTLAVAARERLAASLAAEAWLGVGQASVAEIDQLNIRQASLLAMTRALEALPTPPAAVLVDGRDMLPGPWPCRAVIKGDQTEPAIAAASILAKVHRDELMDQLDRVWPAYGWARNRGYGTKAHLAALTAEGPSPHHRQSFAPVRRAATAQQAA